MTSQKIRQYLTLTCKTHIPKLLILTYLKNWTDNFFQMFFMGTSCEQRNDDKISTFSILMGWTLPSTGCGGARYLPSLIVLLLLVLHVVVLYGLTVELGCYFMSLFCMVWPWNSGVTSCRCYVWSDRGTRVLLLVLRVVVMYVWSDRGTRVLLLVLHVVVMYVWSDRGTRVLLHVVVLCVWSDRGTRVLLHVVVLCVWSDRGTRVFGYQRSIDIWQHL